MLSMEKKKLLLIDDSPDNLEVLTVLLGDAYQVFSHSCGTEALKTISKIRPDLLLLDVRMSPMTGIEFLHEVRSRNGFRDVPAIAVTALARDVETESLLAARFQAVVTKPIVHRDLESLIEALLMRPVSPNAIPLTEGPNQRHYSWRESRRTEQPGPA